MNRSRDILALQRLTALVLDHRLSELRNAAARREQSRMQISALDVPPEPAVLDLSTAAQIALRYQLWADARRTELNTVLASQTADWIAARHEARQAFGKSEALRGIAARLFGDG